MASYSSQVDGGIVSAAGGRRLTSASCSSGGQKSSAADWKTNFDVLLNNSRGIDIFTSFLRKELSQENIMFWQQCNAYLNSTDDCRKQMAREIYDEFVAVTSLTQINIDDTTRRDIERHLAEAPVDLFAVAQKDVHKLMRQDPYPRFLTSRLYLDALEQELMASREEKKTNRASRLFAGLGLRRKSKASANDVTAVTTSDDEVNRRMSMPASSPKRRRRVAKFFRRLVSRVSKQNDDAVATRE